MCFETNSCSDTQLVQTVDNIAALIWVCDELNTECKSNCTSRCSRGMMLAVRCRSLQKASAVSNVLYSTCFKHLNAVTTNSPLYFSNKMINLFMNVESLMASTWNRSKSNRNHCSGRYGKTFETRSATFLQASDLTCQVSGFEKICLVSGTFWRILSILRCVHVSHFTTYLLWNLAPRGFWANIQHVQNKVKDFQTCSEAET